MHQLTNLSFFFFSFYSPEWVFYCNVAVHSNSQQTEDGALSEHKDKASDEQAAIEVTTEAHTDFVGKKTSHVKKASNTTTKYSHSTALFQIL